MSPVPPAGTRDQPITRALHASYLAAALWRSSATEINEDVSHSPRLQGLAQFIPHLAAKGQDLSIGRRADAQAVHTHLKDILANKSNRVT